MSHYIRPVDLDALRGDGLQRQLLWAGESAQWTAVGMGPDTPGRDRHVYEVDHGYFVISGQLTVELGLDEVVAGPETFVYVPAGTPHRCLNATSAPVFHLELLTPGPDPAKAPLEEVTSTYRPRGAFDRTVAEVEIDPRVKIFDRRLLVTPADGSDSMLLYEATLKPGDTGLGLHVHSTADQFYYILDGALDCQIGVEQHRIGAHTLAVLPRQVPHDLWNGGTRNERHLSLIAPAGQPNQPGAHIPVSIQVLEPAAAAPPRLDIRFLGHSCFELACGEQRILVDPFLTGNPAAAVEPAELDPTHIFLTHGHPDHLGDTIDIAKRTGAQVVAIVEIAQALQAAGLDNVVGPNLGGTVAFDGGWVRLVPAWHTSTTPGGTVNTPAGLVVNVGGKTIYHLGDTALFSDLALVAQRDRVDVALIPIGGFYTMDRDEAVEAAKLVGADVVIPCHYATFPGLEPDASSFKADVEAQTASKVVVLEPGQRHRA